MSKTVIIILALLSALMSAGSQILLKKSAGKRHKSFLKEYLNSYVLLSYMGYMGVLALNIFLFTGMDYRYGVLSNAMTIVFVMIMSGIVLGEKVTRKKWAGAVFIITGILCFTLL